MKKKIVYTTRGHVLGNLWGGGVGAYSAKPIIGKSIKDITKQATKGLDGSLDSGMGFESLKGAMLHVTKTTTIVIEGKEFTNEEDEGFIAVGKLTPKERDWMFNVE